MDATENKELREQLEQKQQELEIVTKENASLRIALDKMQAELRKVGHVMDARTRLGDLVDIVGLDNKLQNKDKFDRVFMYRVKAEIMYLVNGYDPNGHFQPEKKEPNGPVPVPESEDENECIQTAGLGPGED